MRKIYALLFLLFLTAPAFAVGTIIAVSVIGLTAGSFAAVAVAFAINMVVSAVITKALFSAPQPSDMAAGQTAIDPGNRQQVPPATDNKLPVVYGNAWVGGTIVDLSISNNNQEIYYVLALSEVTNTNAGQSPDTVTFGDVYYGGKKVIFNATEQYLVDGLLDESTGITNTEVAGKIRIYLYSNGSNTPFNSSSSAISIMSNPDLSYKWDSTKLMSNCSFAIIHLTYNANAGVRGIEQTKFQVRNSRSAPGDCFADYMINSRYGAALPASQIDSESLSALNVSCNETFTYTTYEGTTSTQTRFRFDGTISTDRTIMQNLQDMSSCCDCLIKYNEIVGTWGVIVQKPTYTVSMDINDSNIVSAIQITPLDISNSFNVAEVKFPDKSSQDSFASAIFDLAAIEPALLYPNEPVNKQSLSLPLVNDSVRAQYLANRFLKSAREDLQVDCSVGFTGLQFEAGDVVTLTNANYGWVAKLFRINKVSETFSEDGSIICKLLLMEFNPSVYDDVPITAFTPAPNSGVGNPLFFGSIPAPTISNQIPYAAFPSFDVTVTTASSGVTQYAEIWYSAFAYPTSTQRIFAGTTEVRSSGSPYNINTAMPVVTLTNIPAGNWYFFSRMVNSLGTSGFSPHSTVIDWRPITITYASRYLMVAYADDATGGGFSLNPTNKDWFGLANQDTFSPLSNPDAYTWYEANPVFGTGNFLLYINRGSRKFSFATGDADYASSTGAYVPTETATYDPTLWSALPTLTNYIDLDARTGQLLSLGTSSVSAADGLINVTNTPNGTVVAALERFLNFGAGVRFKTSPVSSLTVDIYGRVVGFSSPDNFYFTETVFSATAGQTSFSLTHVVGNILVFRNGELLGSGDFTETSTTIVMTTPCIAGQKIVVLNMRTETTIDGYAPLNISIASSTTNTITYNNAPFNNINVGDQLTFTNTGTPTAYTVSAVNYSTKVITFSTSISGATVGSIVYQYRPTGTAYRPFTRFDASVTAAGSYTPTEWAVRSGFEMVFCNGIAFNALDYNITGGTINNFPNQLTGILTVIQFSENNLSVPCSNVGNALATTIEGITEYAYANNPLAFELYSNGCMLANGSDFTNTGSLYTLSTTPANSYTVLQQQSYARVGAA